MLDYFTKSILRKSYKHVASDTILTKAEFCTRKQGSKMDNPLKIPLIHQI